MEEDWLISEIKYVPRKNDLFSLTSGALGVLLTALGTITPGNNIKVKASRQSKLKLIKIVAIFILVESCGRLWMRWLPVPW